MRFLQCFEPVPTVSKNVETQVQATLHLLIKPLLNVCYPELYPSDYEVKDVLVQPNEVLRCEILIFIALDFP